jgi:hypothetical protein
MSVKDDRCDAAHVRQLVSFNIIDRTRKMNY